MLRVLHGFSVINININGRTQLAYRTFFNRRYKCK